MINKKRNLIKILSLTAFLLSTGATLVTNWVDDRKMDQNIEEKISEALAKREEGNKEES